ncbi:hypothetical protein [Breoghania sp.]|uniref:maleate cis-trans isomerase family protein n=1 Tax=Breoghania sp. TaxID=2065378 RepID=UPI002631489F|nr:hypothetical protein [Breoghania sp.]MDJ0933331.1 hypothetical protein [Breoghania sp.]
MIAFGCTSGSFICPGDRIERTMHEATGAPAVTTAYSVLAALKHMGITKLSMGTPYTNFVNEEEIAFLAKNGIEVVKLHSLQLGETQEERRSIGRVPPEAAYRMCRMIDHPDAQAIFLSCTNLATIEIIEELERDLGKPVTPPIRRPSGVACR